MNDGAPALPAVLGPTARHTAVTCPDCAGALTVQTEGDTGYLLFRCRTGHAFSLTSLLACKEEVLEVRLWTSLTALDELAALLRDLDRVGGAFRVLDANLPIVVGPEDVSA